MIYDRFDEGVHHPLQGNKVLLIFGFCILTLSCAQPEMIVKEKVKSQAKSTIVSQDPFAGFSGSIEEARAKGPDAVVTIEGYVTVPPASYTSMSLDLGFAVEDDCGGIWVKVTDDIDLKMGQRVRVTGTIYSRKKQLVLRSHVAYVEVLEGEHTVEPTYLEIGEVNMDSQGKLITVEGSVENVAISDMPFGWKYFLRDGKDYVVLYVCSSTNHDPDAIGWLTKGAKVRATGYLSVYHKQFEVIPRTVGDIHLLAPSNPQRDEDSELPRKE